MADDHEWFKYSLKRPDVGDLVFLRARLGVFGGVTGLFTTVTPYFLHDDGRFLSYPEGLEYKEKIDEWRYALKGEGEP